MWHHVLRECAVQQRDADTLACNLMTCWGVTCICARMCQLRCCSQVGIAMQRLQYIVSQPDLVVDAVDDTGLEIITGIGKHTHEDRTFGMKTAVEQVLQRHKLKHQQGSNPGVVRVPLPVLQRYLQLQLRQHLLSEFLHGAGWRYLTVFGGMFSAVSAMYVVPKLLLQT